MSTILTIRIWRRPSVRPVASLNAARSHRRPCVWTCQQFVTPRVGERVLGALASKSDFWPMQGFLQNSGGHVRFDLGVRKPWMKFMVCHYLEGIKLMYSFGITCTYTLFGDGDHFCPLELTAQRWRPLQPFGGREVDIPHFSKRPCQFLGVQVTHHLPADLQLIPTNRSVQLAGFYWLFGVRVTLPSTET